MKRFDDLSRETMSPHARERAAFRTKQMLDRLTGPIHLVRQEHANGCAVASIAMVTRISYAEVLDFVPQLREKVESGFGLINLDTWQALQRLGFAVAIEMKGEFGHARHGHRLQPVGEVNIAEVVTPHDTAHSCVVLGDGRVLDPHYGELDSLDFHKDIYWIAAVVPIAR